MFDSIYQETGRKLKRWPQSHHSAVGTEAFNIPLLKELLIKNFGVMLYRDTCGTVCLHGHDVSPALFKLLLLSLLGEAVRRSCIKAI